MTIQDCGKVIEYDFAPKRSLDLKLTVKGGILYSDANVMMAHYDFYLGDKAFCTYHFMTDLNTGKVTHL